jgi:hypothetical protein
VGGGEGALLVVLCSLYLSCVDGVFFFFFVIEKNLTVAYIFLFKHYTEGCLFPCHQRLAGSIWRVWRSNGHKRMATPRQYQGGELKQVFHLAERIV